MNGAAVNVDVHGRADWIPDPPLRVTGHQENRLIPAAPGILALNLAALGKSLGCSLKMPRPHSRLFQSIGILRVELQA